MKQIFKPIILTILIVFATSCNIGQKPQDVAEEFLNTYFAANYEDAAKLCTEGLGEDLLNALEQMQALDEPIRENIRKHTKHYTPQIISTEEPQGKDSVVISYTVVKVAADSINTSLDSNSNPSEQNRVKESRIHLVKTQEGWRVSALK